jgi:SAM-dependent methyltransferase
MIKRINSFHSPIKISRWIWSGASLIRALFHEELRNHKIHGSVLDLGSKSRLSTYYNCLQVADGTDIIFTDIKANDGVVRVNVEEPLPFADSSFNFVLSFHLFEHVYDYRMAVSEIYRVLKPGGVLLVSVPFMHKYHGDPDDFWRLTDSAMIKTFESPGLRCAKIIYVGEGIYSEYLTNMVRTSRLPLISRCAQVLFYLVGTIFDRILANLQARRDPEKRSIAQLYALEHIGVFEK